MNQTKEKQPCYEEMKPYEKFLAEGPEHLSEAELLAIIIRTGTKTVDSLQLAKQVLSLPKGQEKGLLGLRYLSVSDLCRVSGIGQVKAVKIKCLIELSRRLSMAVSSLQDRKRWQTIIWSACGTCRRRK